ncbi:MAG: TlpA disulfide reductase family protein [Spirosomataceae bacterium]
MLIIVVFGGVIILTYQTFRQLQTKKIIEKSLQTLPPVSFFSLDSTYIQLQALPQQPVVIIYFNTACEHCQREVQEIKKYSNQLSQTHLVLLSNESLYKIKAFVKQYQLDHLKNVQVGQIPAHVAVDSLGLRSVPSFLIYDENGRFQKKIIGETTIETLLKYL